MGRPDWRADRPPCSWGSTSGIPIRLKERVFQKRIQRIQPACGAVALRRVRARVRGLFRVGAVAVVAVVHMSLGYTSGGLGFPFWSTGVYREIVPKGKIVYTDSFSDAEGNAVPASHYGMQGDWPPELVVTVTFEEDGGKTKMILQHDGIPPGTMSDCETGWSGSFDKLAESLKREFGFAPGSLFSLKKSHPRLQPYANRMRKRSASLRRPISSTEEQEPAFSRSF